LLTSHDKNFSVIVLAAGKGKRMKSDTPKVLHEICHKPVLYYILTSVFKLNPEKVFVVTGSGREKVEAYLGENFADCVPVFQENQLGTAHAVLSVKKHLKEIAETTLILPGDVPLISWRTLKELLDFKKSGGFNAVLVSAISGNPTGYGRIVKDGGGNVTGIVEEADASDTQRNIKEINTSIYCMDSDLLFDLTGGIKSENAQNEFYLTDIIKEISSNKSLRLGVYTVKNPLEAEGVNDRVQLQNLEKVMQSRINESLMLSGVTLRDSATIYIDPETTIGNDTVIEPFSFLIGKTSVGSNCVIGPFARIKDSVIGEGTKVSNSVIQESKIGRFNSIGPTSFIRPGTVTGDNVKIGACCEIKKSVIADGAKVPHLSYIGDAEIGKDVNVGAATVTCNYDGFHKNKTVIEDGVFIGSDTMLVAPVRVGKGSITAAGSVISEDVPPDSLAIERTKQVNIKEWAKKFREKKEREDSR